MKEVKQEIFRYNGSPITFNNGDSVVINATEMAKPFGKTAKDWLRTKSAEEFIDSLSAVRQICPTELVRVIQGGNGVQGTWMHEDVAMEFARWLSPKFAIWCNDRIKELLTHGVATVRNDDEAIAYAMAVLSKRLDESKQKVQMLESENTSLTEENKALAPKAQYTDEVLQSTTTYTLTQVAHDLGMRSVHVLIKLLVSLKILFKQSGQWQPTRKVADKDYFQTRTHRYFKTDGSICSSISTVVTEKGRQYLHSLKLKGVANEN